MTCVKYLGDNKVVTGNTNGLIKIVKLEEK